MPTGLILFAHGARDHGWRAPFDALVERVRALAPGTPVRVAFLELMEPDLETAAGDLAQEGADAIRIVPVFFGQGGHLRRDLPQRVAALRERLPGLSVSCAAPAGEDDAVLDAIARFCVRGL